MFNLILYHTQRSLQLTSYDEESRKIKLHLLPCQFKTIYNGLLNQYFLKDFSQGIGDRTITISYGSLWAYIAFEPVMFN